MDNPIRAVLVLVFAVATLGATLMMPWGELQLKSEAKAMPHTLRLFYLDGAVSGVLSGFQSMESELSGFLTKQKAEGSHGEYVYGLAMALALTFGAIAIMTIGSADESEKTLIPTKK